MKFRAPSVAICRYSARALNRRGRREHPRSSLRKLLFEQLPEIRSDGTGLLRARSAPGGNLKLLPLTNGLSGFYMGAFRDDNRP